MSKLENISAGRKSGSGKKCECSVCHSSKISFACSPSVEDAFFLLNKLLEVSTEQCEKALSRQPEPSSEQCTSALQLLLCSSCEIEIERAKKIYHELVVAVGQFREIQKKLAISIKAGKSDCRDERQSDVETERGHCWSLFGNNIVANTNSKFLNVEESEPFLVEDLRVKLKLTTGVLSLTQWVPSKVTDGVQNVPATFPACNQSESVLIEHNEQDIEYLSENETANETLSQIESYGDGKEGGSHDKISGAATLKGSEDGPTDINSPFTVKEEYDFWVDEACINDQEEVITVEEDSRHDTFPPEIDRTTVESEKSSHINSKKDSLQCSKCDMYCSTGRGLSIHKSRKHGICGATREINQRRKKRNKKRFSTSEQKTEKRNTVRFKGGKYKCSEKGCEKSFRRPYQLNIHLSRHTNQPMFKCELCEEVFYTKPLLRKHIQKTHPEISKPKPEIVTVTAAIFTPKIESYQCNLCSNKVFKTNSALMTHKTFIHGLVEPLKDRVCPEQGCGMKFTTENSLMKLRDHLSRCHGWEPAYKCSKCDKAFNTWKQKWRHEQKIHEDGLTERPFICDLCGKRFTCADYLHTHRNLSHKSKSKPTVVKNNGTDKTQRYICDLCGTSYLSASALGNHKRMQPVMGH